MRKRTVQHRVQSEEKIKNQQLAEARRQLKEAIKQIASLQKQLRKAIEVKSANFLEEDPVSLGEKETGIKIAPLVKCAVCANENIASIQLPTGIMYVCKNCGEKWKSR